MTKGQLLRWSLILVTLTAFGVWLDPTHVVWGWLRGEAFYDGRPTRFWRHELTRWHLDGKGWGCIEVWTRDKSWLERVSNSWKGEVDFEAFARPQILQGDATAQDVLKALVQDPSEHIREHAELGLTAIRGRQGRP